MAILVNWITAPKTARQWWRFGLSLAGVLVLVGASVVLLVGGVGGR